MLFVRSIQCYSEETTVFKAEHPSSVWPQENFSIFVSSHKHVKEVAFQEIAKIQHCQHQGLFFFVGDKIHSDQWELYCAEAPALLLPYTRLHNEVF